eukprot:3243993-Rhodomonas_salina.2
MSTRVHRDVTPRMKLYSVPFRHGHQPRYPTSPPEYPRDRHVLVPTHPRVSTGGRTKVPFWPYVCSCVRVGHALPCTKTGNNWYQSTLFSARPGMLTLRSQHTHRSS